MIENHVRSERLDSDNIEVVKRNFTHLNSSSQSFATSLLDQLGEKGALSAKQWYWVDVLAQRVIDNANAYGRRTGKCMFCRRILTSPTSIKFGYGPVCAENNHLPWG